jgi:paraquat-inducible protein B
MKTLNPVVIGAFVLGAMLLTVATVIFVGSMKLFSKEITYVLYFNESVNGLSVGAPVKFKGVPVGRVSDIRIRLGLEADAAAIPVYVRMEPSRRYAQEAADSTEPTPEVLNAEIAKGLRGQLQMESIITGQLYVELDYLSEVDGAVIQWQQRGDDYPEIPTVPSVMARIGTETTDLFARLSSIDFQGISEALIATMEQTRDVLEPLDLEQLQNDFSGSMAGMLEEIAAIRASVASAGGDWQALSGSLRSSSEELAGGVREATGLAADVRMLLHPAAPLRQDLSRVMQSLLRMSEQVSALAEMLEREPAALLRGRTAPDAVLKPSEK